MAKRSKTKRISPEQTEDALNDQERLFITYYCGACQFNGAKAARWAGYSEVAAKETASRLLTRAHMQKAVKEEMGKRAASHDELVRDIIEEYCKLAFSNITNATEFNSMVTRVRNGEDLPEEITAAIRSVNMTDSGVKVEFHDKRGALADLAKIMGMLTEDFRVRPDGHESIVERLYRQRMGKDKNGSN